MVCETCGQDAEEIRATRLALAAMTARVEASMKAFDAVLSFAGLTHYELKVPLPSGEYATLKCPRFMGEVDFDVLRSVLAVLDSLRPALTAPPPGVIKVAEAVITQPLAPDSAVTATEETEP